MPPRWPSAGRRGDAAGKTEKEEKEKEKEERRKKEGKRKEKGEDRQEDRRKEWGTVLENKGKTKPEAPDVFPPTSFL